MTGFAAGQRWFSTAEPELGLGTVLRVDARTVQIVYTGTGDVRQYAMASAPLIRAGFRPGERVRVDERDCIVDATELIDGVLHYRIGERRVAEGALDADQPVSQADQRLASGRVDPNARFEFRRRCLRRRAEARADPAWGILGARVDLVPHQLQIASIARRRRPPRLLLADEVGLGKTIEACMILAQALASGRARRVLVLVPQSLQHQWLVELKRRFNLDFSIYDEERCEAIESGGAGNPFEDAQTLIVETGWLAGDARRREQALAAGWDLLVVDEAHHLSWSPESASPEYALVELLSERTPGLILLTATPEQLGLDGHFARLRLLDPARYTDREAFRAESARYLRLSAMVETLREDGDPDAAQVAELAAIFGAESDGLPALLGAIAAGEADARGRLIDALVDRHGTGRVMLRNRRAVVGGFPDRVAHLRVLAWPEAGDPMLAGRLRAEFLADVAPGHVEPEHDYPDDPRMAWLSQLLARLAPAKCLLICRSRAKVQALEEALRLSGGIPVARFHEDMSLLQRDRNAAYFAEVDGARLLICSEIGAEGRNFQFAQHLILWDLPLDPDQLEQRIGRLDRIGQRGDVHIHAAALPGTAQELLLRWYDEGLDAFATVCPDGRELLRRFGPELVELAAAGTDSEARERALSDLVARTRAAHAELSARIAGGRDRLLELATLRGAADGELLQSLQRADAQARDDEFAYSLLEQFGVHVDPLDTHAVLIDPEYVTLDAFADLKGGPRRATLHRPTALTREDLLFLRDDHPLVLGAMDLVLSGEAGNATFVLDDALPARTAVLEAVYVLECIAQAGLHVDRFLPPTPIEVAVDSRLALREGFAPGAAALRRAADQEIDLAPQRRVLGRLVPPLLARAQEHAAAQGGRIAGSARARAQALYAAEIERLEALARINPNVRQEEVAALRSESHALLAALDGARPRLDCLRLVASPDFLTLRA
ncbi:MAG TPA: RNA polymerase-associated protein RapA [Xanthomonadaceae bacterium]|nr:RNA polymerase-associated protein RapA [Xanthomonadaceae bacterium]